MRNWLCSQICARDGNKGSNIAFWVSRLIGRAMQPTQAKFPARHLDCRHFDTKVSDICQEWSRNISLADPALTRYFYVEVQL